MNPRLNKFIPWIPTPKQKAWLLLDCKEAFFGGAAGGSKSVSLLFAASQYLDVPNYDALLIRDTFSNLSKPKGLIDLSFQWFTKWREKGEARWTDKHHKWIFPKYNSTLSFGHMDGPKAHYQYQGPSYHFIGIDEVVQIPRNQALYLFSRLRKDKKIKIPIRFRCASNPPAADQVATGAWVKERYVDPDTREDGVIFVPSLIEDNPYLDLEDYDESLKKLDPITRMQLRYGDWNISVKGRMFEREWFLSNMVNAPFGEIKRRIRYWDLAACEPSKTNRDPDWTVGLLMSINHDNDIFIEHIERFRENPGNTEKIVKRTARMDGIGVEIIMEQDPGQAGKAMMAHYKKNVLFGFAIKEFMTMGMKLSRIDIAKPFSSHAMDGNVYMVRGHWVKAFLDEAELFPDAPKNDQVVCAAGAYQELAGALMVEPRIRWV